MKKLTTREKISLALVAIVALAAVSVLFFRVMLPNWQQVSTDITTKQNQLEVARKLVDFDTTAMALEERIQKKTGLQGKPIISDGLFKTLEGELTVDNDDREKININLVGKPQRLTKIEGVDIGIANSILAYKKRLGEFDNLDQLKKIRGNIFTGENPQAVISRRLNKIAHDNGIGKIGRFEQKLIPSKKQKPISPNAKKTLINEIYLSELDAEIQALKKMESEDEKATEKPQIAGNREFPMLPSAIPVKFRKQVAQDILANEGKVKLNPLEFEGATVSDAKEEALMALNATDDDIDVRVLDKGRKGFLGIMAKPAFIRVSLKEDEQGIIAAFRQALSDYNEEIEEAILKEESEPYYEEDDYGDWDEGGFGDDSFSSDFDEFLEDFSESDSESDEASSNEDEGDKDETDAESNNPDMKSSEEKDSGEKEEASTADKAPEVKQDEVSEGDSEKDKPESEEAKEEIDVAEDSGEEKKASTKEDIPEAKQEDTSQDDTSEEDSKEDKEESIEESIEDKIKRARLNEEVLVSKLVDYLIKVSDTKDQLREWLDAKSMPSQYLKQHYVVEMSFNCKLENLVKFIYKAESQLKWLYVRGLKVSISNPKEELLKADMTFVAMIM